MNIFMVQVEQCIQRNTLFDLITELCQDRLCDI